ncbi:MAG: PAP fibrillin [Richelia sp. RM2_1_2]|nr:PAP fibrillin [Richelia sp. SM2_1_7]NJM21739.1 PAP fibrillin [Richelia sp. SM1_7_0]NJN12703.1 PAP fibrillin [Richelia sp. RM1_1_1]NJO30741.1 PAP fibrillin [Richelia sp. SL_2_1]NJO65378.1 PAP fibrillin [Richelia sp. RM2_1_2]
MVSDANRQSLKTELIRRIEGLSLRKALSSEPEPTVDEIVRQLEEINPTPHPLSFENLPQIYGNWQVAYNSNETLVTSGTDTVQEGALTNIEIWENLTAGNNSTIIACDYVLIEVASFAEWKMEVEGVWKFNEDEKTALVTFSTFEFKQTKPFPFPFFELKIPIFEVFRKEKLFVTTYLDENIRVARVDNRSVFVFLKR